MKNFKNGDIVGFRQSKTCYSIGIIDKFIIAGDLRTRAIVNIVANHTFTGIKLVSSSCYTMASNLVDESSKLDEFPEWFI